MDAPHYPPAAAYEPPAQAPFEFGVETVSLAELMHSPSAWAVVLKHAPMFRMIVNAPQTKPLVTNFTVDSFVTYGVVSAQMVEAIDQELRALPADERPSL